MEDATCPPPIHRQALEQRIQVILQVGIFAAAANVTPLPITLHCSDVFSLEMRSSSRAAGGIRWTARVSEGPVGTAGEYLGPRQLGE